jgi:hypothetical protein
MPVPLRRIIVLGAGGAGRVTRLLNITVKITKEFCQLRNCECCVKKPEGYLFADHYVYSKPKNEFIFTLSENVTWSRDCIEQLDGLNVSEELFCSSENPPNTVLAGNFARTTQGKKFLFRESKLNKEG